MTAFLEGMIAGYGIAIPVGAIAILIVQTGLVHGLWPALFAGAGAATADLLYAALAALTGTALAAPLAPYAVALRIVSGLFILAIGILGLWKIGPMRSRGLRAKPTQVAGADGSEPAADENLPQNWSTVLGRTYLRFLGLTLLNPLTVAYFAALILGGGGGRLSGPMERAAFVMGAGVASLSWQSVLAAAGAFGRRQLGERPRYLTSIFGYSVVVALGLRMLLCR